MLNCVIGGEYVPKDLAGNLTFWWELCVVRAGPATITLIFDCFDLSTLDDDDDDGSIHPSKIKGIIRNSNLSHFHQFTSMSAKPEESSHHQQQPSAPRRYVPSRDETGELV